MSDNKPLHTEPRAARFDEFNVVRRGPVNSDVMLLPQMPTLEELEGEVWGEPEFDSHLVSTCHQLRKRPIEDFTTEDLRIMIGKRKGREKVPEEKRFQDPLIHVSVSRSVGGRFR